MRNAGSKSNFQFPKDVETSSKGHLTTLIVLKTIRVNTLAAHREHLTFYVTLRLKSSENPCFWEPFNLFFFSEIIRFFPRREVCFWLFRRDELFSKHLARWDEIADLRPRAINIATDPPVGNKTNKLNTPWGESFIFYAKQTEFIYFDLHSHSSGIKKPSKTLSEKPRTQTLC